MSSEIEEQTGENNQNGDFNYSRLSENSPGVIPIE